MAKPLQLTPGAVLGGDFRIVEPLSAGGMGALYVAEQISTGKRRAVKVMHRQLVREPKLRERFVQEARVGALIESDHVVDVIAAGIDETTTLPWIAMELLAGTDLGDFVEDGGHLPIEELVQLLRQLCHALGAAHEAGVVHRDIKPENVFLAKARSAAVPWTIKVLDFGIAKVAAQAKMTATAALGSPAWMAPEQTESSSRILPATDVWALGLMTYWLMARRPYWRAAGDPDASVHALMREVLFEPLASASDRARSTGAEPLPEGFDDWFGRCVTRDPDDRYPNATEAFDGLEQLLLAAGYDVAAVPASTRPSFERISTIPIGSVLGTDEEPPSITSDHDSAPDAPTEDRPLDEEVPSSHLGDTVAAPESDEAEPSSSLRPSPTRPMAPAHLSATASTGITRPSEDFEAYPAVPLRSRWAQVLGTAAIAAIIVIALVLAFRSVPEEPGVAAAAVAHDDEPAPSREGALPPTDGPAPSVATGSASATRGRSASRSRSQPTSHRSTPAATSASAAASTTPAANSSTGPFAEPPPERDHPKPAGPSTSATRPPAGPPAQPASTGERDPFDRAAAVVAVQRQAEQAAHHCRDLPGPRLVAATVVFAPSGKVKRVALAHRDQRSDQTTGCVRSLLGQARVQPYRGHRERISVVVPML